MVNIRKCLGQSHSVYPHTPSVCDAGPTWAPTQGVGVWYDVEKNGLLSTNTPDVAATV